MKRLFCSLLIVFCVYDIGCAQFIKAVLQVDGLTCSLCANATVKQLKPLHFIDSIGIDYEHDIFLLYFKKDSIVNFQQIRKKVENAGFSIGIFKATYTFKDFAIDSVHSFNLQNNTFHFVDASPQILNGENQIQLIDEGFISKKEYRRYANYLATHKDSEEKPSFHAIYKPG